MNTMRQSPCGSALCFTLKTLILSALVHCSLTASLFAATINSTPAGGDWGAGATWVGGTVPGAGDDAVINGTVSVTSGATCASVTVQQGAVLQNGGNYGWVVLTVAGNVTNSGTIRDNPAGNAFDIDIGGNIANNGSWILSATYIASVKSQTISQAAGTEFRGSFRKKNAGGTSDTFPLVASTDIVINASGFDGNGYNSGNYYWGKFDMGGHNLTLKGGTPFTGAILSNVNVFSCLDSSAVYSMNIEGAVTLGGRFTMTDGKVTFNGNVTVRDTMQNGGGLGWLTPRFNGKLTNNGLIRNNPRGNALDLDLYGDIANNGVWTPAQTYFASTKSQAISQSANTEFRGTFTKKNSGGTSDTFPLVASTDIVINAATFDCNGYNSGSYYWGKFNMGGHNLVLKGGTGFTGAILSNVALFSCLDSSAVYSMNIAGAVTLGGRFTFTDGKVTFDGDVVVRDTMQNGGGLGWLTPRFNGKVVNNGLIRNNPRGNALNLDLYGDVTNNGIWTPSATYFASTKPQTISQATGVEFRGTFTKKSSGGTSDTFPLVASTNIVFNSSGFDAMGNNGAYFWGPINMAGHDLTLKGPTSLGRAVLSNVNVFSCLDSSSIYSCAINGAVSLGGRFTMTDGNVTFNGDVTVRDTLQNGGGLGWITPKWNGKITNYGLIRNNPAGNSLEMAVYGDVENNGRFMNGSLTLYNTDKTAHIDGRFETSVTLNVESGKTPGLVRAGSNLDFVKTLYLNGGKTLEVPSWATTTFEDGASGNGAIVNNGTVVQRTPAVNNTVLPFTGASFASMRIQDKGSADTVRLTTYAGAVHPAMASSVRRWWRLANDDTLKSYSIKLVYADSLLNGNKEDSLQAYLTKDNGATWIKISTPINTVRDTVANAISVGSDQNPITVGSGDIVLSSGAVVRMPSISTSIIGRTDIRVGPPNRYTIAYWNNSVVPTGSFMLTVQSQGGVSIRSATVNSLDSGKTVTYPRDSLMADTSTNSVLFFVSSLAPNELRTFDITVLSDRTGVAKQSAFVVPLIWVGAAWLATSVVEEYASNYMVNSCYEMWRPYEQGTDLKTLVREGAYNTFKKTNEEFNVKEAIGKKAAEKVVEKVEHSIGRTIASPAFLVKDIMECLGNSVKGMKDYVNGGFDENKRSLRKVTSWDPNAKAGPAGFGDSGYIATSAPATYTIFFENKKEALAAAYKIVVVDSLDASVFDTASVSFGPMSHAIGKAARAKNVLTWVFDSIELPPNVTPPQGEGWVQFTVHPKANLATGTRLKNTATITFDLNAPIATNTAMNILDLNAPVTGSPKATFVAGDTVMVSYKATDSGCGVKATSVFISQDGAPFTLAGTSSAGFLRVPVRSAAKCKFYVQSQDNVGNTEKPGAAFDATPVIGQGQKTAALENFLAVRSTNARKVLLRFGLKTACHVRITLIDLKGRQVATILDREYKAGVYALPWDRARLGSGAYFLRMTVGTFQTREKLFLWR
jgi:hypothetical protein